MQMELAVSRPRQTRSTGNEPGIVIGVGHPRRSEAEQLIERAYRTCFGVRLTSHYPHLIGVSDGDGALTAAAGCRIGSDHAPFFAEHYLDEPLQAAVSRGLRAPVSRGEIAEIGSLGVAGRGGAVRLFAALARHMQACGARVAVATATSRLRRAFDVFSYGVVEIGTARRERMPAGGPGWDGYFAHDPAIVCGRVETALVREAAQ